MKMHESVTTDRVVAACEARLTSLDDKGYCVACGATAYGVEPDARKYTCESCGEPKVYGCEELLLYMVA